MAKHLHQLDLFGMETAQPVHIKAPVEKKKVYQAKKEETVNEQVQLVNEDLPSVSRTPMSFIHSHTSSKRGRKSFASMDAEIHKLNIPASEELVKKLYYPIGEVATWFNVNTTALQLTQYSQFLNSELNQLKNINSLLVFIGEAGKQYHVLHVECLVSMQLGLNDFVALKDKINLMAIGYANEHNIQFANNV